MKQRIKFSESPSIVEIARRGAFGGKGTYVVPTFGPRCVCCNADANARLQDYDLSDSKTHVTPLPVPVCLGCKDHAFVGNLAATVPGALVCFGLIAMGLGVYYATKRPIDEILEVMIAIGAVLTGLGMMLMARMKRRNDRARRAGHHPDLSVQIITGTRIDTTNETLAEELLVLNPHAVRVTPLFWRRRQKRDFPNARTR